MSRKFTIKVAGCGWVDADDGSMSYLYAPGGQRMGAVTRDSKGWNAIAFFGTAKGKLKTMSAAKAYVIKQLAGEGKESK